MLKKASLFGLVFCFSLLVWFGFGGSIALAQLPDSSSVPVIKTAPSYPDPTSVVKATLEAYAYDLTSASISWFIDGIEQVDAKNNLELTFQTGPKNVGQTIVAQIRLANGQTVRATKTIVPTRVDIVIEADSVVPVFYKGRALPSSGSTIRAIAIPDTTADPNHLSYTWRVNNQVLFGGSQLGKQVAEFSIPFGGSSLLSVDIADSRGNIIAKRLLQIDTVEPVTIFYEDNPLRGLHRQAITGQINMLAPEMTIRAEPYFMDRNIFASNPLIEWNINGRTVENPSNDPQIITLRKGDGSGGFRVDFHIRNLTNLLQGTRGDFGVTF